MRAFLVLAAVAAAGLALPTAPPAYAVATCQGLPATIEGSGGTVMGTPGPDVIVASGLVSLVDAGDGDDTICVLNTLFRVTVDAGAGDDRVDATHALSGLGALLGPGANTFTSGAGNETVRGVVSDGLTDSISTGGGHDFVEVEGPASIDLGAGADHLSYLYSAPTGSTLSLGTGVDTVSTSARGTVRVDLAGRTITTHGVTSTLRHAENVEAVAGRVVVRGDGDDNDVRAWGCVVDLTGGPGNDVLTMANRGDDGPAPCRRRARMAGGAGSDRLRGQAGDNVLIGGRGRDSAYGAGGWDRCQAEVRHGCES